MQLNHLWQTKMTRPVLLKQIYISLLDIQLDLRWLLSLVSFWLLRGSLLPIVLSSVLQGSPWRQALKKQAQSVTLNHREGIPRAQYEKSLKTKFKFCNECPWFNHPCLLWAQSGRETNISHVYFRKPPIWDWDV